MKQMTTILIDSSSYNIYRVTATMAWYRKSSPDKTPALDNKEFMEALERQYWSHLGKLSKKHGIPINQMYLIRDCPISAIWRKKIYPKYKKKRSEKPSSNFGPFVKHLNETVKSKFKKVLRIDGAEADDVIAVYVKSNLDKQFVIVGNDSDYNQLFVHDNVEIVRPKKWESVSQDLSEIDIKVLSGDRADEIPPCYKGCGVKTATDLVSGQSLVKRLLRKTSFVYANYLRNKELIDFNYIPSDIRNKIFFEFDDKQYSKIQLGLCCLNTELREKKIFCSRKPILRTVTEKGIDYLKEQCLKNCQDLLKMIEWNYKKGIKVLRISSGLFPHYSNPGLPPKMRKKYTLDFAQEILTEIGDLARKYGQRLTFHPGQYNVLASPTASSFDKTILDLDMHAEILDRMKCGQDSVMVIHGGGMYGDKEGTKKRWAERYTNLPNRIKRRLVLENCEKCFSIKDCLDVSNNCGVPIVFDTHHYDCYIKLHPDEKFKPADDYIADILATWDKRGIKPKFHVSEQCCGGRVGKHSDLIEDIPEYLLNIPKKYGVCIDIMIEAKLKEQAIFKLIEKYSFL